MRKYTLPSTNGVYIFKKNDEVIYVGKSVNINARVKSHFENAVFDHKEFQITHEATSIDHIVTDSEFKALLLESSLIQKYKPKYNVIWRDDKSYLYIKITIKEPYPKIFLTRKENDGKSIYFGPYSSVKTTGQLLREIRRIIPFCTQRLLSKRACFYSKIGLCDPCPNLIENVTSDKEQQTKRKQYRKNIVNVIKILKGNIDPLVNNLKKQLAIFSDQESYENAIKVRDKILRFELMMYRQSFHNDYVSNGYNQSVEALTMLSDSLKSYFSDLGYLHRIECYDISNLLQKKATASMVVLIDGLIDKSQYKRFKIRSKTAHSDFEMIEEVINRRFNNKWDKPDLLIIDGGKPQIRTVLKVFKSRSLTIPVIGIAKSPDRMIVGIEKYPVMRFMQNTSALNLVRLIRDESHRFARKYHLLLRNKSFINR